MRATVLFAIAVSCAPANAAQKKGAEKPSPQIEKFLKEREAEATKLKLRGPKRDAFMPEIGVDFHSGKIGLMKAPIIKVVEVVDDKNMIVDALVTYTVVTGSPGETGLQAKPKSTTKRLWLRGIETKGLADGAKVTLDKLMEVTKTETYDTVDGGVETVFVVEPFDETKLEPFLPKKKRAKRAK